MKKIISSLLVILVAIQVLGKTNIEVINIENKAVQDYMADAQRTYTDSSDFRVSVITKYNDTNKYGKKLYWPAGKLVTWTPTTTPDKIKETRITVSMKEDFTDSVTHYPDPKTAESFTTSGSFVIRNLLPNKKYYYKVEEFHYNGDRFILDYGFFRTEGQVRMIQVRNCSNVRDLGGWMTQYGKPVRYGKLYRSASLETMTREGRHDFVDNLKVVAELDLRHETKRQTSALGADRDYLRLAHGSYTSGISEKYRVYVTDLRWIIARMREHKNVDWHCAIGCDRCGTLSFLIEGLLGLNELDLCRDYELSTFSLGKNNRRVRSPLKSMISHIKSYGPKNDLARCFYNYWLHIGMHREELDYFLREMLGISDISRLTRAPESNDDDN